MRAARARRRRTTRSSASAHVSCARPPRSMATGSSPRRRPMASGARRRCCSRSCASRCRTWFLPSILCPPCSPSRTTAPSPSRPTCARSARCVRFTPCFRSSSRSLSCSSRRWRSCSASSAARWRLNSLAPLCRSPSRSPSSSPCSPPAWARACAPRGCGRARPRHAARRRWRWPRRAELCARHGRSRARSRAGQRAASPSRSCAFPPGSSGCSVRASSARARRVARSHHATARGAARRLDPREARRPRCSDAGFFFPSVASCAVTFDFSEARRRGGRFRTSLHEGDQARAARGRSLETDELLVQVVLDALHLPMAERDLLLHVAVLVLKEHDRWRSLLVPHIKVRELFGAGLEELPNAREAAQSSLADLEHRAVVLFGRPLLGAAARALGDERVRGADVLAQLGARGAQQRRAEAQLAASGRPPVNQREGAEQNPRHPPTCGRHG
mmetsp:Transcript_14357/g.44799  ORF Transcript_14357/g.44799 Transcript_14357/m.44799 type:complete len:446 (+) Transcript_14357:629-1966(+)